MKKLDKLSYAPEVSVATSNGIYLPVITTSKAHKVIAKVRKGRGGVVNIGY